MRIVTISGSLREASSNAALLRAAARVAPDGVEIVQYDGMGTLPHFNPDLDAEDMEPPASVRELRELLIGADAILISSPESARRIQEPPGLARVYRRPRRQTGRTVERITVRR